MAKTKTSKKYKAIVKLRNNPDGSAYCVVYRFDDLLKFTTSLDSSWNQWKWFNVYSNKEPTKGLQLSNFTKNKKPTSKYI
jgi:hypothetical protein